MYRQSNQGSTLHPSGGGGHLLLLTVYFDHFHLLCVELSTRLIADVRNMIFQPFEQ